MLYRPLTSADQNGVRNGSDSVPATVLLDHPDPESRLYIGGFQGLRGYPDFYATGSRRLRLTTADRVLSSTVLFNTFQLGYVVFVDAARVQGGSSPDWNPWYAAAEVPNFTGLQALRHGPGVSSGPQVVIGNVIDF